MILTQKTKDYIDNLDYKTLLERWRFSPIGSPWFQGDVGGYWKKRMIELRSQKCGDHIHVAASKAIGWTPSNFSENLGNNDSDKHSWKLAMLQS